MLGINLVFAGFALTLNGCSYFTKVDDRAKAVANMLVGIVIAINAVFQVAGATDFVTFGFGAAMWLFALNYFIIASHVLLKAQNYGVFGLYGLFAAVFSIIFAVDTVIHQGPWEMIFMWAMWAVLWGQSFVAICLKWEKIDRLTPYVLVINGLFSTFIPGILILLGIIL